MLKDLRHYFKARFLENKFYSDIDIICNREEWRKLLFFRAILNRGDRVLDIGANVGFFTTFFSHFVGREGLVEAYEANPYVFNILKKRTKRKQNIECHQEAVSTRSGEVLDMFIEPYTLFYCGTVEPKMVTANRFKKRAVKVKVQTRSLDSLEHTRKIKLVKVDVEGHEDAIFRGGSKLLQQTRPLVIFEYMQRQNFVSNSPEILAEYGYKCLDNQTLSEFTPPKLGQYATDIIAIPEEDFSLYQAKFSAIQELTL